MICTALTVLAFAGTAPPSLSQEDAEREVFRSWRELTFERNGKERGSDECVELTRKGPTYWGWKGELVQVSPDDGERVVINPHASPMEIDFFSTDKDTTEWVRAGIWKLEGQGDETRLVIVRPDRKERVRDDRDPLLRPTGFETTKENKWEKSVYVRCKFLEQFDPNAKKK